MKSFSLLLIKLETIQYFCVGFDSAKLRAIMMRIQANRLMLSTLEIVHIDDLSQSFEAISHVN